VIRHFRIDREGESGVCSKEIAARGFYMKNILKPDQREKSVLDIQPQALYARGVRFLLMDLDNTLIPWNEKNVTPEICAWIEGMKAVGITPMILSNNHPPRIEPVCRALGIGCIPEAGKPSRRAYLKAAEQLGAQKEQCAYVGDQLFTDIAGARRAGLYAVLVEPIAPREYGGTKVNRALEWLVGRRAHYTLDPRQIPEGYKI